MLSDVAKSGWTWSNAPMNGGGYWQYEPQNGFSNKLPQPLFTGFYGSPSSMIFSAVILGFPALKISKRSLCSFSGS